MPRSPSGFMPFHDDGYISGVPYIPYTPPITTNIPPYDKTLKNEVENLKKEVAALKENKISVKTTSALPKNAYGDSVGYDLESAVDTIIYARRHKNGLVRLWRALFSLFKDYPCSKIVQSSFDAEFDPKYGGFVYSRSGLAAKGSVAVLNGPGVIEGSYRKTWGVILFNYGDKDLVIKKGDRIAQAIWLNHMKPEFTQVRQLSKTERGEKGLGSTGV